jgi:hypothetical protein
MCMRNFIRNLFHVTPNLFSSRSTDIRLTTTTSTTTTTTTTTTPRPTTTSTVKSTTLRTTRRRFPTTTTAMHLTTSAELATEDFEMEFVTDFPGSNSLFYPGVESYQHHINYINSQSSFLCRKLCLHWFSMSLLLLLKIS